MQDETTNSLITNFQDNREKVQKLGLRTTEEIAAKLIEKRQYYQNRLVRVPGRKVKFFVALGAAVLFSATVEVGNIRRFTLQREEQVRQYEAQVYSFFQMIEDRYQQLAQMRKNYAIDALFADEHERKQFQALYKPFAAASDYHPLRTRTIVSNLGMNYGYRTIFGTTGAQYHKSYNNPSV